MKKSQDVPPPNLSAAQQRCLAKVLKKLSRRAPLSVRTSGDDAIQLVDAAGGASISVNRDVALYARRSGLIEATDRLWSPSRKGMAWLRRWLSHGDGFQAQHQQRAIYGHASDGTAIEVNLSESPLAWLRRRKDKSGRPLISGPQFEAGERLRADYWCAQMSPRTTTNWREPHCGRQRRRSAPGHGTEQSDRVIAAKTRLRRALEAVGPELSGVLVDVCCELKGLEETERCNQWTRRSGKVVLGLALTSLARHYGLLAAPAGNRKERRGRPANHWGSADYRPTIDHWRS